MADISAKILKGGEAAWIWWLKRNLALHRGKIEPAVNTDTRFSFPSWDTCVSFVGQAKTYHPFCCKEGSFNDKITEQLLEPVEVIIGKPAKRTKNKLTVLRSFPDDPL